MKIFDVTRRLDGTGEYILGSQETGSHACYLVYGVMKPGERGRELRPGHGHEEIVFALQGDLDLSGDFMGTLKEGQAMHLKGEEKVLAENRGAGSAIYCISGGHSGHGHH